MNNKLLVALVAALTVAGNVFAYTLTVKNELSGTITVEATYPACRRDIVDINPGATEEINMKACCLATLVATLWDGQRIEPNLNVDYGTGAGVACRSIDYVVKKNRQGTIVMVPR